MANKPLVSLQFPDLADTYTIPTKTSDLTNDSGFITSAPVTSVNGQTGAVTLTIPSAASSGTPAMDGTASRGSSAQFARADHVHPSDTSKITAPSGGTVGQVLKKTANGTEWADESGGGGSPTVTEVTVATDGDVSMALDAGKIYHFTGELTSLSVTLNAPASGTLAQWHFDFDSGSTAPTLTLPVNVNVAPGFSVGANMHYEIDILNEWGRTGSWVTS